MEEGLKNKLTGLSLVVCVSSFSRFALLSSVRSFAFFEFSCVWMRTYISRIVLFTVLKLRSLRARVVLDRPARIETILI